MGSMDAIDFAREFGVLYRELYRLGARRVGDGRDVLAVETTALLLHLAQSGPVTLTELSSHLQRSPSTLSAKVSELESQGLLARQRDDQDARRALIWLSGEGRRTLMEALEVLDGESLAAAAGALEASTRDEIITGLRMLIAAIPSARRLP
jgi:DNA-binding MarR family transcriptional regulator